MILYLLIAPLMPIVMAISAREVLSPQNAIVALTGFTLFIPSAIITTIIRNQFPSHWSDIGGYVIRVLLSDHLFQLAWLLVCIMVLVRTRLGATIFFDQGSGLLIFSCCYFFAAMVHRALFLSVAANGYELFVLPSLRIAAILVIQIASHNLNDSRRIMFALLYIAAIIALSVVISALIWYKFLVTGTILLVALFVVVYRLYTHMHRVS